MTLDYKRHGTTRCSRLSTSSTALSSAATCSVTAIRRSVRFPNTIDAQVQVGKPIHAVVDNYAAHKHPRVR